MAFKKTRKQTILAKYNGIPTDTDNLTLSEVSDLSISVDGGDIDEVSTSYGSKRSYIVQDAQKAEFDLVFTARANTLDTAPEMVEILKSALLTKETITAGDIVKYETETATVDHLSSTIIAYEDEEKYTIEGCVSNIVLSGKVKEPLNITASVKGWVSTVEMTQTMPTVTNDSGDILVVDSITGFTSNGSVVNISDFSFDMQNEIVENYNVGVREFTITDFDPKLEMTLLKIKNQDVWTPLFLQTLESIEIIVKNGKTNTKKLVITIPKALNTDLSTGDQNGLQTITKTYRAQNNVGDDNFSIAWGEV